MKRLTAILLAIFLILFLSACGDSGGKGESDSDAVDSGGDSDIADTDSGNSGSDSGNSGSDSGNSGSDSGNSGSDSGDSGSDSGDSGSDSGNSGSDSGNSGSDSGNSGSDSGNSGSDSDNSGSDSGNSGSDSGNSGSDSGNSGSDSGNSGSDSGNSGSDSGDSGSDSGDSGSDSGNSGSDSGNSGSDSGNSGSDSGDSGSDSGNSGSDSGDSGSTGGDDPEQPMTKTLLEETSKFIKAEDGGNIVNSNHLAALIIPKGALKEDAEITMKIYKVSGGGDKLVSHIVELSPHGMKFNKNLLLIIKEPTKDSDKEKITPTVLKGGHWSHGNLNILQLEVPKTNLLTDELKITSASGVSVDDVASGDPIMVNAIGSFSAGNVSSGDPIMMVASGDPIMMAVGHFSEYAFIEKTKTKVDDGFVCMEGGSPCVDLLNIKMWSSKSIAAKNWKEAETYCQDLIEGGFTNWRLPTIGELRTLVRECDGTNVDGMCGVYDDCLDPLCFNDDCNGCEDNYSGKYSVFGDMNDLWSSSPEGDIASSHAWYMEFRDGSVNSSILKNSRYVRCTRDPGSSEECVIDNAILNPVEDYDEYFIFKGMGVLNDPNGYYYSNTIETTSKLRVANYPENVLAGSLYTYLFYYGNMAALNVYGDLGSRTYNTVAVTGFPIDWIDSYFKPGGRKEVPFSTRVQVFNIKLFEGDALQERRLIADSKHAYSDLAGKKMPEGKLQVCYDKNRPLAVGEPFKFGINARLVSDVDELVSINNYSSPEDLRVCFLNGASVECPSEEFLLEPLPGGLDPATGLIWSAKANYSKDYCENLEEDGHDDWRLPTISELRTLIRNSPKTEFGGPCGVVDDCLSSSCEKDCNVNNPTEFGEYSLFKDFGEMRSSSPVYNYPGDYSWQVDFSKGKVFNGASRHSGVIRCVRFSNCGDGEKQTFEICDDGANNGTYGRCNSDCTGIGERCGDGILQRENCAGFENCVAIPGASEACDDGNEEEGDYCSADCQTSFGFCGDGEIKGGEFCDDGANNGTYGHCNSDCLGICGDGTITGREFCDDGANNGSYGRCKFDCLGLVTPYFDSETNLMWSAHSNDPMYWNDAQNYCENLEEGGFSNWRLPTISELRTIIRDCPETEFGGSCPVSPTDNGSPGCNGCAEDTAAASTGRYFKYSLLGDSALWSSTQHRNDDYAWYVSFYTAGVYQITKSSLPDYEDWWVGLPVRCVRFPDCGDGEIQPFEACDDGANNGTYGYCDSDCTGTLECGDGIVTEGKEQCDFGDDNADYGGYGFGSSEVCKTDCSGYAPYCGDGIVNGPEICDDGANNGAPGHCNYDCLSVCGDGIATGDEFCDDGANNGTPGYCNSNCSELVAPYVDSTTGLTWSSKSQSMFWNKAKIYCENLEEGGFSDWRLPTISELRTIIRNLMTMSGGSCNIADGGCLSTDCRNVACDYGSNYGFTVRTLLGLDYRLWSSSPVDDDPNLAWGLYHGAISVIDDSANVRCVRGEATPPVCGDGIATGDEFCDHGNPELMFCLTTFVHAPSIRGFYPLLNNGKCLINDKKEKGKNGTPGYCNSNCSGFTYSDPATGLVWSSYGGYNGWPSAKAECEDLTEGGFSNWRLPTISELRTLIRNCPATMTGGSCGVTDSCFSSACNDDSCGGCDYDNTGKYSLFGETTSLWSSSPLVGSPGHAWTVDFYSGAVAENSGSLSFRCLRDDSGSDPAGDSGADSGDSGADSGDSGADSGDSGADSGDSGADSGDSGADSGDSGSELSVCGSGSATPCLDSESGLAWSGKASDAMTWDDAKTYCENLTNGGFSDWRLPTISELRTLIRNCPATMTGGSCGVTGGCLEESCWNDPCFGCGSDSTGKYSLFGDTYWFWSSSPVADNPDLACRVDFGDGYVGYGDMDGNLDVRCVRFPDCGDGEIQPFEACDEGANNGTYGRCNSDCTGTLECGDGIVTEGEEQCDSGANNADYGEASSEICKTDCSGYAPYCGDGIVNGPEICDEGALNGTYGHCNSDCLGVCGDGIKSGGEFCDEGANNGTYGRCNSDCSGTLECGDGIVTEGEEQCDSGANNADYGGASSEICKTDCSGYAPYCGDEIKSGGEFCDEGALNGTYGHCNSDCLGVCGDGIKSGGEFCDDGEENGQTGRCDAECLNFVFPYVDSSSGLMWSAKASDRMYWNDAKIYCENLTNGGFFDWRLPTISELRTLIRNCDATMTGGSCNIVDGGCLSLDCRDSSCNGCDYDSTGKYSLFGDTYEWYWSSSPVADDPDSAWDVYFEDGCVYDGYGDLGVRCVR